MGEGGEATRASEWVAVEVRGPRLNRTLDVVNPVLDDLQPCVLRPQRFLTNRKAHHDAGVVVDGFDADDGAQTEVSVPDARAGAHAARRLILVFVRERRDFDFLPHLSTRRGRRDRTDWAGPRSADDSDA